MLYKPVKNFTRLGKKTDEKETESCLIKIKLSVIPHATQKK